MKTIALPSIEYLNECFYCNFETGVLTWKRRPLSHFDTLRGKVTADNNVYGRRAGGINGDGYRSVEIGHHSYLTSRIIMKLATGVDPAALIDHKNRVRSDDRLENLREATRTQNNCNTKCYASNTCGAKGVTFRKSKSKYIARVQLNGKRIYVGAFTTLNEAKDAYMAAARKLHGEFFYDQPREAK